MTCYRPGRYCPTAQVVVSPGLLLSLSFYFANTVVNLSHVSDTRPSLKLPLTVKPLHVFLLFVGKGFEGRAFQNLVEQLIRRWEHAYYGRS